MNQKYKEQVYNEYIFRINKVQDYIEANLNGDLSLNTLAAISGFSKYHFCRIFRGIIKETILSYINRIRLERAMSFIRHNPAMSITDIAMMFGYSDSAVFARSFKKYYSVSASEIRKNYVKDIIESKNGKANIKLAGYNKGVCRNKHTQIIGSIEVKNIKEIKAIYLRHLGCYEELVSKFPKMLGELLDFAKSNNLVTGELMPFSIYHDNPEFTKKHNLKTSVCLVVNATAKVEGKIGFLTIPSGKYAIGHFELKNPIDYSKAWDYLYGEWLPKSGFQPNNGYNFEMYMNNPNNHAQNLHFTDIYLPIKAM